MQDYTISDTGVPIRLGQKRVPHPLNGTEGWTGKGRYFVTDLTLADALKEFDALKEEGGNLETDGWAGNETLHEQREGIARGWADKVGKAEALMDRVAAKIPIESFQRDWDYSIAGAFPSVPDALAGNPESMLAIDESEGEAGAIRIWVNVASSGIIPASDLERRGECIMALTMFLSTVRPVEVWSFYHTRRSPNWGGGDDLIRVLVSSAPMDISATSYPLMSTAWCRSFMYGLMRKLGKGTRERTALRYSYKEDTKVLMPGPHDIIVPALRSGYSAAAFSAEPEKWVREQAEASIKGLGEAGQLPEWARDGSE